MPGSLLVAGGALAGFVAARERRHVDWSGLGWAFGGRTVGTAGGVWLIAMASPRLIEALVGGTVLGTVVLTAHTVRVPVTRRSLLAAGAVLGVTGTATTIGGPPIALLYQHGDGPRIRATLGVFLLVGALMSLGALAAADELRSRELAAGCLMVPFMAAGFALSASLSRHLDAGRLRSTILAVAAASAITLVVRSVL